MLYEQFHNAAIGQSIVVEEDGKVAYAYLMAGNKITGDVWLYNIGDAPVVPEWEISRDMPFKNTKELIHPTVFTPIKSVDELNIEWRKNEDVVTAMIFIRGKLHAVLKTGFKPGWCVLANFNGPLANTIDDAPGGK